MSRVSSWRPIFYIYLSADQFVSKSKLGAFFNIDSARENSVGEDRKKTLPLILYGMVS